jgi:hypothetical protein
MSRWPRRFAVFFLVICPLVVVAAYLIEHWRGARAWDQARARLLAEGETLDLASLWPPSVPRDENFCTTPALDGLSEVIDGDETMGEPARKRERLTALADYELNIFWHRRPPPPIKRNGIDWAEWRTHLGKASLPSVPNEFVSDFGFRIFSPLHIYHICAIVQAWER